MDATQDPDWYFEHVLLDAAPGRPAPVARGPVARWQRSWQSQWDALGADAVSVAAREHGFVLTRRAARDCGAGDAEIRRLVRRGWWSVPARGIVSPVAIGTPDPADRNAVLVADRRRHALVAAAATTSRDGHVACGRSAAILHGLPTFAIPRLPELTAAKHATAGRHHRALVRSAALSEDELSSWFGAPVTSVRRTLVDLARHDRRDGLMAADAALRESLVTPAGLSAAMARATGWPGVVRARAVLAFASPLAESPLESIVRLALHDDGFPPPRLQAVIGGYRVDMIWARQRLILEADGRVKYTADERWQEKVREQRLVRLGYRVIRVLWSDVTRYWPRTSQLVREALC